MRTSAGGVGRNIAENLARLGTDTRLLSAVGNDQYGHLLLEVSQRAGVDVRQMLVLDGQATFSYLSLHDGCGEMSCAVNDMGIDELTPAAIAEALREADEQGSRARRPLPSCWRGCAS